jgi:sulfate/thiosulfate transport system permease protein
LWQTGVRYIGRVAVATVSPRKSVLPGFLPAFGLTWLWLAVLVLVPLIGLIARTMSLPPGAIAKTILSERALASYSLSFGASFIAATIATAFGFVVAWVLVRVPFPGRKLVDALVDLPFALPTAVAGLALTFLYAPDGWIGQFLAPLGLKVAFTRVGIVIALVFVSLPFTVRTVQPVLQELPRDVEEASLTLGASPFQTFVRVIFPRVLPALLTGFALAFARGVGEYGSVVFVSGNLPMKTEITPLLIVTKLEQYDYAGATALALVMLLVSFALLIVIHRLQAWTRRAAGEAR